MPQSPLEQAIALHKKGKLNPARKIYREVLARQPRNADAHELLGLAAARLGDTAEAIRAFGAAATLNPASFDAVFNLGMAQKQSGRAADAEASFRRALGLMSTNADVHFQLGTVLVEQGRLHDAIASFRAATAASKRHADAHFNLGQVLAAVGDLRGAVTSFGEAAALEPKSAAALIERGRHLLSLHLPDPAIETLTLATEREPKAYDAHALLGAAYRMQGRFAEAIKALEAARALDGTLADAVYELMFVKRLAADWAGIDGLGQVANRLLRRKEDNAISLHALSLVDDPAVHQRAARAFVRSRWPGREGPRAADGGAATGQAIGRRARTDRPLRVGYFSSDLGNHPVSYAIAGFIAAHDPKLVETHAFALSRGDDSGHRPAIVEAFNRWHQVDAQPAGEIVRLAREREIDIAVDLNGHTAGARTPIFIERAAPIQVNYLGYPATMGTACMDYLIADRFVVPPGTDGHYDERIVRLPGTYLPNDLAREGRGKAPTRADNGLPATGIVFASFNTINKITPEMFACWMRLLKAVPESVLWVQRTPEAVQANLRRQAEVAGIAPSRLVFAAFVEKRSDHLTRQALADLFLDCTPYNAHTTAAEALWAGVPVVTCTGAAFPSRVAGGLLQVAGIQDLVTTNLADYEAKALSLARDPSALAAVKARVAAARSGPLFDARRFARHMEWAYAEMARRSAAGEAPAAFDVPEIG